MSKTHPGGLLAAFTQVDAAAGAIQELKEILRRGEQDVRESETISSVPQDEVDAIKPHVSRQVWALIQLQLLTGARSSELLNLRPVDFQNTSTKVWLVELGDHKTSLPTLMSVRPPVYKQIPNKSIRPVTAELCVLGAVRQG